MLRLLYIGLASVMTFTPMGIVYATDRGQGAATATRAGHSHYSGYHSHYYYYGGGRGGWLGDSYGWGRPGFDGRLLFERLRDFLAAYEYPVALIAPPGKPLIP